MKNLRQSWFSTNVLNWIGEILTERFGVDLKIRNDGEYHRISVLGEVEKKILVKVDGSTFARRDSNLPITQWAAKAEGWNSAISDKIPAPGVVELPYPLVQEYKNRVVIKFDLIGLIFWMLTRQEEIGRADLDMHGRFPAAASNAVKNNYLERPIVDEWIDILRQVLQKTWPNINFKKPKFRTIISHDVDDASRYLFCGRIKWIYRSFRDLTFDRENCVPSVERFLVPIRTRMSKGEIHKDDPFNTFDWLMDIADKNGCTSTFFFMCGQTDPKFDSDYTPEHPAIRNLMRKIYRRGHRIGLHPSYATYKDAKEICFEADRLRRVAAEEEIEQDEWGARMHYLRWEHPFTLRNLDAAQLAYDSSLGYADRAGFRCGTCFSYTAFDAENDKMLNIKINPLIAMECSIIAQRYMNLGLGEEAFERFLTLKTACRKVNGNFSLLWHNTSLQTSSERKMFDMVASA